eukprot:1195322-Prorocentrum_minimum.AAC.1
MNKRTPKSRTASLSPSRLASLPLAVGSLALVCPPPALYGVPRRLEALEAQPGERAGLLHGAKVHVRRHHRHARQGTRVGWGSVARAGARGPDRAREGVGGALQRPQLALEPLVQMRDAHAVGVLAVLAAEHGCPRGGLGVLLRAHERRRVRAEAQSRGRHRVEVRHLVHAVAAEALVVAGHVSPRGHDVRLVEVRVAHLVPLAGNDLGSLATAAALHPPSGVCAHRR